MKLSLQTDYSLRTLMYLSVHPGRANIASLAAFFAISEAHVAKVVHHLGKLGYIRSIRGSGGGLELAKSPEDISIGEIVQAVEGTAHLLECLGTANVCVIQKGCKLLGVLAEAERIQRDYLLGVRLSEVLPFSPSPTVQLEKTAD